MDAYTEEWKTIELMINDNMNKDGFIYQLHVLNQGNEDVASNKFDVKDVELQIFNTQRMNACLNQVKLIKQENMEKVYICFLELIHKHTKQVSYYKEPISTEYHEILENYKMEIKKILENFNSLMERENVFQNFDAECIIKICNIYIMIESADNNLVYDKQRFRIILNGLKKCQSGPISENIMLDELIKTIGFKLQSYFKDQKDIYLSNHEDAVSNDFLAYFRTLLSLYMLFKHTMFNGLNYNQPNIMLFNLVEVMLFINGKLTYNHLRPLVLNLFNHSIQNSISTTQTNLNRQLFIEAFEDYHYNFNMIDYIFGFKNNLQLDILNYGKLNTLCLFFNHLPYQNQNFIYYFITSKHDRKENYIFKLLCLVDKINNFYSLQFNHEENEFIIWRNYKHQIIQSLLILSSFYHQYSTTIWQHTFLNFVISGSYQANLFASETWLLIFMEISVKEQIDQFDALFKMLCLHKDNETLFPRLKFLLNGFTLHASNELKDHIIKKISYLIQHFDMDPIALLSLISVIPLNILERENTHKKLVDQIIINFNKYRANIYQSTYLTRWLYICLRNIFTYYNQGEIDISNLELLLSNSLKVLNNHCGNPNKKPRDIKLILANASMLARAPKVLLEKIVVDACTLLYTHISSTNTMPHITFIELVMSACFVKFKNETEMIKFSQLAKNIIKKGFEYNDWSLHFNTLWFMTHLSQNSESITGIEKILSSQLHVLFMEFIARKDTYVKELESNEHEQSFRLMLFLVSFLKSHPPPTSDVISTPWLLSEVSQCVNKIHDVIDQDNIVSNEQAILLGLAEKIILKYNK